MSTSPINAAKNAQGYVAANQRQRCGTCQHAREIQAGTHGSPMQCRKGAFMVTVYAVCTQWQIIQPPGFKAPRPGGAA
jgi:hypothetical protein